jgi:cysteine desulfuration protein SufE
MLVEDLVDDFQLFEHWEDRYTYLLDLGKALPEFPDGERVAENKVDGCLSQVWFVRRASTSGVVAFDADSDSAIVRGLIAVLRVLFHERTSNEVAAVDVDEVFRSLGLDEHLSVNRRNGFYAMVGRVRLIANAET